MIETLRIEDLAVVERAEIEFGRGLNVLTGETGAGKSLVLGALGLLAGQRGTADLVREGAREAVVEAVFRTDGLPDLEAELERRGLRCDEGLVVRRSVAASGRGRARVSGELVPVSILGELFAGRIEVSSQHESQALLRGEVQGRLLDAFGELTGLRESVRRGVEAWTACDREVARLRREAAERARRRDFLEFQVREIDEAKLRPGEIDALRAERSRLVHAERLRGEGAAAAALLAGEPMEDVPGAADLLGESLRRLQALARLDPGLEPLAERVAAAGAELRDAAREVERYAEGVEADPGRLAEAEERLAVLDGLRRKYGAGEPEILAFRDRAAEELRGIGTAEDRCAALEAERAASARRVERDAAALSEGRAAAAGSLSRAVERALRGLAMPEARFEAALEPAPTPEGAPCGPAGRESAVFRLSANRGQPLRALRRVASGGELSRVFLALKNVLRSASRGMVLVFDEVDAAIGGRVADRVGRVLGELAGEHQVLCITHLPQIAAAAQTHLRVEKRRSRGRTVTEVTRLDRAARVEEIARMAGGAEVSEATRRHARELLATRYRG